MKNPQIAYKTRLGTMYQSMVEDVLASRIGRKYEHQVQLILTSPPFPLNNKKRYGNLQGAAYIEWLSSFAPIFRNLLKRNGSVVMEMGNAWTPGQPVMSTLTPKALIAFQERGQFNLCQQFICYNPARLPSPAQWVNIERIRVKDSFTHLWWMSPTVRPKADNRRVLKEYSQAMLNLLKAKKYNAGKRPSEHKIGEKSFLKNNKGAIPSNVLTIANTTSSDNYQHYCRNHDLQFHPARMPMELSAFFIKFLTKPGDLVLDPFAGSNTTGATAEHHRRRWISVEPNKEYVAGSKGRFVSLNHRPRS